MGPVKRSGPTRQDRAAATRRRMLDAAQELFCELGFRATTMEAVAERAGVAVQTLYFTFRTKDGLLQEVQNRAVLGDDALPPPEQPWYAAAMAESDAGRAVDAIVEGLETILRRVAPLVPVFHAVAADPAGEVHRHAEELRRAGMAQLVDALARKAPRRRGLSRAHAVDLLMVLTGPELYRSLVLEYGWSSAQWRRWVSTALRRDLVAGPGADRG